MTESELLKVSKGDLVLRWLGDQAQSRRDYILQDLPRWIVEHRNAPQEEIEAFSYYWARRQEFRSVIRHRVRECKKNQGIDASEFERLTAGINWLFVSNLYLSCPEIGSGLYVEHGFSSVMYAKKIGENFRVNQNVTVGSNKGGMPSIGNDVSIYTHAVVVGPVCIGDNVKIGAGAVVVDDIPSHSTVVPQKPRVLRKTV